MQNKNVIMPIMSVGEICISPILSVLSQVYNNVD